MATRATIPSPATSTDCDDPQRLTEAERARLTVLETEIRGASWRAAAALREIHTNRLYRESHPTFEAYAEATLELGRSWAYDLVHADAVREALSGIPDTPEPATISAAAALYPLLVKEGRKSLRDTWKKLHRKHRGNRVTARHVHDSLAPAPVQIQPSAPPERPESKPGEVYELGRHRLLCGDSTDTLLLATLLHGVHIDCLCTDPPYGVDYQQETSRRVITNDQRKKIRLLLSDALHAAEPYLVADAPFYVFSADGVPGTEFRLALDQREWRLHQTLIWVKPRFVLGRCDYQQKHEPILYGWAPGDGNPRRYGRDKRVGSRWFGANNAATVFEVPSPRRSDAHPTMKPPELLMKLLENSVPEAGTVLDLFAGSGSTLEAAERLGLTAYLVELEPGNCDVIRQRWSALTSKP